MKPQEPRPLTVAIPTCNGAAYLAETLSAILAQGDSFPILLCDDHSEDGTAEVARDVAGDRFRVTINTERLGLAGNWNRCVTLAGTPFVAIVHQDDVWRAGHLDRHLELIARHPGLGWIASASRTIDANGREIPGSVVDRGGLGPIDRIFDPGEALRELATSNPLRCSAVTISSIAHAELGGFDPSFGYVVDWDYWLRVARSYPVAWVAEPTVDIRWHPASETHRFARETTDLDETEALLERLFASEAPRWADSVRLRRQADRRLARAYLNRSYVALKAGDGKLARLALRRSLKLSPGLLGRMALDPRLAIQMAALAIAPGWAARVFRRQ